MNCLLTGGSGFLGSHVADELAKKGHQLLLSDSILFKVLNFYEKI